MGDSAGAGSQGAAAAPGIPAARGRARHRCELWSALASLWGVQEDEAARATQRGRVRTAPAAAGKAAAQRALKARGGCARRLSTTPPRASVQWRHLQGFLRTRIPAGLSGWRKGVFGSVRTQVRPGRWHCGRAPGEHCCSHDACFNPPFEVLLTCVPASLVYRARFGSISRPRIRPQEKR